MTFGADQNFGMPGTGPNSDDLTRQIGERLQASELRTAQVYSQIPNSQTSQNSALAETLSSIVSHIETSDQRTAQAFQGLQQQMAQMGQNVQGAGNSAAIRDLENRLNTVVSQLEANMAQNSRANDRLQGHVTNLASQVAAQPQTPFDQESAELKALDEQLQNIGFQQGQMGVQIDDLAQRVHQNVTGGEDPHISALQNQVQELQNYIDTAQPGTGTQPVIDQHLADISNRLAETENRLSAISSLEANIQDLTQRVGASSEAGASAQDSQAFKALNQALGALRQQAQTSEEKTNETLEAVHDTLEKVITRIAQLEQTPPEVVYRGGDKMQAGPQTPAAPNLPLTPQIPVEFQQPNMAPPPSDAQPGFAASMPEASSMPHMGGAADIPSSTHSERPGAASSSFIQAARKAAQANIGGKSKKEEKADKAATSGAIEGGSKSRRKPLLIAAAAVLLIIGGLNGYKMAKSGKINLPVISKYIGGGQSQKANETAKSSSNEQSGAAAIDQAGPTSKTDTGEETAADKPLPASDQPAAVSNQSSFSPPKKAADETAAPQETASAAPQSSPFTAPPAPAKTKQQPLQKDRTTTSSLSKQTQSSSLPKTAAVKTSSPKKQVSPPPGSGYADLPKTIGSDSLRRAAASGNRDAQFIIATKYLNGEGVKKDISKAIIWYQRAAAKGLAPAQYRLGTFYEKGRGVKKDKLTARIWYERAAEQGNRKSMHNLAVIYADANNGKPDFTKAALWFRKASERDLTDSQFNMAILSERGLGVPKDPVEAYKWFAIAGAKGDKDSEGRKNALAKKMDPRSLVLAKLAVDNWSPRPIKKSANYVDLKRSDWRSANPQQHARYVQRQMISEAQSRLNQLGYKAGPPDGIMGKRTREAITSYQKKMGLNVTGSATAELIKHLRTKTG